MGTKPMDQPQPQHQSPTIAFPAPTKINGDDDTEETVHFSNIPTQPAQNGSSVPVEWATLVSAEPTAKQEDVIIQPTAQLIHGSALGQLHEFAPRILVAGVGGGGSNAVNHMVAKGLQGT